MKSSNAGGFRMEVLRMYGGTVSHGGTCLTLRLRQAGGGSYQWSIQMCFGTKKHNLPGSTGRQHLGNVGIAAKRKKAGWDNDYLPVVFSGVQMRLPWDRGDFMYPTIDNGDIVVCDRGGYDREGIYVIHVDNLAQVKRLVKKHGGVMVISDNARYPTLRSIQGNPA